MNGRSIIKASKTAHLRFFPAPSAGKDRDIYKACECSGYRGYSARAARLIYKSVRFFLHACGFKFSMDREDLGRNVYSGTRRMDREHIIELWEVFNEDFSGKRNRALLMLGKDSGLRVSDMAGLTASQFWEAKKREVPGVGEFRIFKEITTVKTGEIAHPHIGPEAVEALKAYLGDRKSGQMFLNHEGKPFKAKDMTQVFMNVKGRKKTLKQDYTRISAHSMRKYHYTLLPFRDEWILWLEGKATSVYIDDPSEVTQAYIDNYSKIRVFEPDIVKDMERDHELERLKAELKIKDKEIASLGNSQKKLEVDIISESKKLNNRFDTEMKQMTEQFAARVIELGMTPDMKFHLESDPDTYKHLLEEITVRFLHPEPKTDDGKSAA